MNFEAGESKIYFKPINSDEEYKELGKAKELKAEPLIEDGAIPTAENIIGHELTGSISVSLEKNNIIRFKKMFGFNTLKSKRFKKLLMSVGFDRNEAEKINNFFKYNNAPRYKHVIDIYSDNSKVIKDFLKGI